MSTAQQDRQRILDNITQYKQDIKDGREVIFTVSNRIVEIEIELLHYTEQAKL